MNCVGAQGVDGVAGVIAAESFILGGSSNISANSSPLFTSNWDCVCIYNTDSFIYPCIHIYMSKNSVVLYKGEKKR